MASGYWSEDNRDTRQGQGSGLGALTAHQELPGARVRETLHLGQGQVDAHSAASLQEPLAVAHIVRSWGIGVIQTLLSARGSAATTVATQLAQTSGALHRSCGPIG